MMGTMRTLISNGTLVTGAMATEADVIIDGEQIVGVVEPGPAGDDFDRVIDATGRYVIPGGVDMHTHMELPVSGTFSADNYETGTKAALVIVHISSQEAFAEAVVARDQGLPVFAETCPQYLWLAQEDVPEGFEAAKFVCSPPLRRRSEGHQAALWSGVSTGRMGAVAADHCPFTWEQKEAGRGDFRKIPNGLGVVEHRMDLVYQGVVEGWIPLTRWIEVTAETPAKISEIYPKKGTIAPGSDADVVVYDPAAPHTLSAETHSMNLDYSVFEGAEIGGGVETVMMRGEVIHPVLTSRSKSNPNYSNTWESDDRHMTL